VPSFPTERVYSTVYVMRSEALAREVAESAGSARSRACVQAYWATHPGELDHEPYKSHVEVSSLASNVSGVKMYGLRQTRTLPAAFASGRTRPSFYDDTIGFALGASDIILKTSSAPRPLSATTVQQLLGLLLRRAEAHRPR
jgi:hypothetical protein